LRKDGSVRFGGSKVKIIFVRNKSRQGVVKSRNLGISMATGDIVAFIDDDGAAKRGWTVGLLKGYRSKKVVGVGGPVIDPSMDVRKSFNLREILGRGISRITKQGDFHVNFHMRREEDVKKLSRSYVNFIQGGNMSFRRDALMKVNGFDPRFKGNFYREETDLCLRILKIGKIVFEPSAIAYHNMAKTGGTRDVSSKKDFLYWYFRNSSLLLLRALDFRVGVKRILNQCRKYIDQMMSGDVYLYGRDYLSTDSRAKMLLSIFAGVTIGILLSLFSDPSLKRLAYQDPQHIIFMSLLFTKKGVKVIDKMRLQIGKSIRTYRLR
jgi:GT2 family glycosyltransferase